MLRFKSTKICFIPIFKGFNLSTVTCYNQNQENVYSHFLKSFNSCVHLRNSFMILYARTLSCKIHFALYLKTIVFEICIIKSTKRYISYNFLVLYPIVYMGTHNNKR